MWWLVFFTMMIMGCSCERPAPTEEQTEPIEPIEMLWSIPYEHVGTTVESSPLPLHDSLVVMSAGRDLIMVDQNTGEIKWENFVDEYTNIQTSIFATDGENLFATHAQDPPIYIKKKNLEK